jgi:hypothetical protein
MQDPQLLKKSRQLLDEDDRVTRIGVISFFVLCIVAATIAFFYIGL